MIWVGSYVLGAKLPLSCQRVDNERPRNAAIESGAGLDNNKILCCECMRTGECSDIARQNFPHLSEQAGQMRRRALMGTNALLCFTRPVPQAL